MEMAAEKLFFAICGILLCFLEAADSINGTNITDSQQNKFDYTTFDLLQYTTPEEEAAALDRLHKQWLRVLEPYHPSNVNFTLLNSTLVGLSDLFRIKHHITGETQKPVDMAKVDLQLLEEIGDRGVEGIRQDISKLEALVAQFSQPQSPETGFNFTDTVYLAYKTPADRDALLQLLVPLWQDVLNVSPVRIAYVQEFPLMDVGTRNMQVAYTVNTDAKTKTNATGEQKRLAASISKELDDKFTAAAKKLANPKITFDADIIPGESPFFSGMMPDIDTVPPSTSNKTLPTVNPANATAHST